MTQTVTPETPRVSAAHEALHGRVSRLTVLVALGTHAEMTGPGLAAHLGYPEDGVAERYPGASVLNYEWWEPDTFTMVGTIGGHRIAELSDSGCARRSTCASTERSSSTTSRS